MGSPGEWLLVLPFSIPRQAQASSVKHEKMVAQLAAVLPQMPQSDF